MNPPYDPNNPNWNNPQQPNPGYHNPNPQQPPFQQGYNPQQPPFNQGYIPQQPYQPYIPPYNAAMHSGQMDLPNATNVQICGIAGIVLFWNLIGIILNIVALVMASGATTEYERMPGRYTESSYNKVKTGKICGLIGLCLLGLLVLILIGVGIANA